MISIPEDTRRIRRKLRRFDTDTNATIVRTHPVTRWLFQRTQSQGAGVTLADDRIGWRREPRSFMAALWLTIATALLCAILPTGLPQSQVLGSAFSPATTSVALRGHEPRASTAVRGPAGDPDGPAASPPAILPTTAPEPIQRLPALAERDAFRAADQWAFLDRPEIDPSRPRAPPRP